MSDILERLAACIAGTVTPEDCDAITLEACAEIARLRLTDGERKAVERAAEKLDVWKLSPRDAGDAATLRALLARLSPPAP